MGTEPIISGSDGSKMAIGPCCHFSYPSVSHNPATHPVGNHLHEEVTIPEQAGNVIISCLENLQDMKQSLARYTWSGM